MNKMPSKLMLSQNFSNQFAIAQNLASKLIKGVLKAMRPVTQTGEQLAQLPAQLGYLSTSKISCCIYKKSSKDLPTELTQFVHSFKTLKTAQNCGLQNVTHSFTSLYYYY
jgi:hypothetical protein